MRNSGLCDDTYDVRRRDRPDKKALRMKAIVHDTYGTPDVLELRELDPPSVGPADVAVRVHAASVNPLDWHFLTGTPYLMRMTAGLRRPKQIVAGVDLAGTVVEVGADVTDVEPGDRVFGSAPGAFAEIAVGAANRFVKLTDDLSFADAAALPVAGLTAIQALRDHGRVGPGCTVLINGAAGGVGTYAVQLAVAMGADVTAVCSGRNVDMVRGLGAHRVIDYVVDDFVDGTRFDVIIDNVGNRSFAELRRALAPDGTYVMVSGPKGTWIRPIDRMLAGRLRFLRGDQTFVSFTAANNAAELETLLGYVERGELRSVIDRHYPLAETAEAIRYLATGHARAKVVIDVVG